MAERAMDNLRPGKGAAFVKGQLRRLPQSHDDWEVGFGAIEEPHGPWLGVVVEPRSTALLASLVVESPPTVNDLATLLADAMNRPALGDACRPRSVRLLDEATWAELHPHLVDLGIKVMVEPHLPTCELVVREFLDELRKR
jgi:hypothetical protein